MRTWPTHRHTHTYFFCPFLLLFGTRTRRKATFSLFLCIDSLSVASKCLPFFTFSCHSRRRHSRNLYKSHLPNEIPNPVTFTPSFLISWDSTCVLGLGHKVIFQLGSFLEVVYSCLVGTTWTRHQSQLSPTRFSMFHVVCCMICVWCCVFHGRRWSLNSRLVVQLESSLFFLQTQYTQCRISNRIFLLSHLLLCIPWLISILLLFRIPYSPTTLSLSFLIPSCIFHDVSFNFIYFLFLYPTTNNTTDMSYTLYIYFRWLARKKKEK